MAAVVEARELQKRYGVITALDGIDLTVLAGELFGLVGPNGAGKTTLLALLAGLVHPTGGTARVLGHDPVRRAAALRPRLGYLSEEFTLYGTLTVDENLDFFARLYGVPVGARERRKAELLDWSRLAPFRTRRAGRLSGGMQKKLHLCSALIHEPELLLLDEPTTGVDPVSRRELWEILHDLVGRGLTLVVATPYMDEAAQCDRVALLDGGRMLGCDAPEALRAAVPDAVWEVRTAAPDAVNEALGRANAAFIPQVVGDRVRVMAPAGADVAAALRETLPAGILEPRRAAPTMEDVFVALVLRADPRRRTRRPAAALVRPARPPRGEGGVAVQLETLTKRFGDFVAVDRVSLSVARGEVFGFLGPNGSGKTTTMRMLCGLLAPSAGRAEVLGHDVARDRRAIQARMGYVSQRFSLYLDLTVAENLGFFGRGYGLSPGRLAERMAWALDLTGLRGDEGRLARELSGGARQRLALGCALLHEPEILFLDEPTAGVDPLARREFWGVIGALGVRGTTVFVTTHYLDDAEHCRRLALMYQGRLIAEGRPQDLKDGIRAGVMLEIDVADPGRAARLLRADPRLGSTSRCGDRLHVLVEDVAEGRRRIEAVLAPGGLLPRRIEPVALSLEDLFVLFVEMEERGRRERDG